MSIQVDDEFFESKLQNDSLQICCKASTYSAFLGRRIDAHKDEVCATDGIVDVRAEEEVSSPALLDHIAESRLKDWEVHQIPSFWIRRRVPCCDPGRVDVDDGHVDVGTAGCDNRAGGTSDVACADAADAANGRMRMSLCCISSADIVDVVMRRGRH